MHAYELDTPTGVYAPTGIFRGTLRLSLPFPLEIDLKTLVPRPRR